MYTDEQRRQHILDLQTFLRRIQREESHPSPLVRDGIFGPETEAAVRQFQQQHGLRPTGKADADTWNLIYNHYVPLAISDTLPTPVQFFPPEAGATMAPGEKGCPVIVLQSMLNTMAVHFSGVRHLPLSGVYDEETELAVREAQVYFQLEPTGVTDRATWDALAALHNAYHYRPPLSWTIANR